MIGRDRPAPGDTISRDCSMTTTEPAKLRILIVDDEPLIRWSLAQTLTDRGHSVAETDSSQTTVEAVSGAEVPFDVALLDLLLPDSNDLGVMRYLRRVAPHTQIILMTALSTPEIEREAIEAGVYRVVRKPFEIGEVASLVLEAHQSRDRGRLDFTGNADSSMRRGRDPLGGWRRG